MVGFSRGRIVLLFLRNLRFFNVGLKVFVGFWGGILVFWNFSSYLFYYFIYCGIKGCYEFFLVNEMKLEVFGWFFWKSLCKRNRFSRRVICLVLGFFFV